MVFMNRFRTRLIHSQVDESRLAFLDVLRGIAAIAVFFAHSGEYLSSTYYAFQDSGFHLGNFGVVLFFLVSGFIIPVSLERHNSLQRFWIQRVFRLYPLYWVSLAGILFLSYFGIGPGPRAITMPTSVIVTNALLVQPLFGHTQVFSLYWTLLYELMFYWIMTFAFLCKGHTRTTANTVTMICMTMFAYWVLPRTSLGLLFPVDLLFYLMTMFVGSLCYRVYEQKVDWRLGTAIFLVALTLVVVAPFFGQRLARLLAYLVFAAAFLCRTIRWPSAGQWLGRVSYSVYLMHLFVITLVPPLNSPVMTVLTWLVLVLAVSAVSERVIERTGILLGRRLIQRLNRKPTETGATGPVASLNAEA